LFAPHFCLVRRPNEKGVVETLVGFTRRNFFVPVPHVADFTSLNATLMTACREDLDRRVRGQERTKAELLVEEQARLLPLPAEAFVARRVAATRASSESLVRFDRNDYSVPTEFAHREVTVSGGIDDVACAVDGRVIATHRRSWRKERTLFDPTHYFALLERKPGALDFALPLASFAPPANFGVLRRRLEAEFGDRGTREYVKVLRLLETATPAALERAVTRALDLGTPDAAAVRLILEHAAERPCGVFRLDGRPQLQLVRVAAPDLHAYRALTAGGG
jgi:predicted GNAT superfamily acetyltransferase